MRYENVVTAFLDFVLPESDNSQFFTRFCIWNYALSNIYKTMFENLIQLGFSEREASIYLMLLRVGPSHVSSLARRVDMKRVTVYSVLDALNSRGLVTYEKTEKGRRYIPYDPEHLLYSLEKRRAELNVQMDIARDCVDRMHSCEGQEELLNVKPIIYYRGVKAAMEGLKVGVDPSLALFAIFLNFMSDSLASSMLKSFLMDRRDELNDVSISTSSDALEMVKKTFPSFNCMSVGGDLDKLYGNVILQKNKVYFLLSSGDDLQMMELNDPIYAKYFHQMLMNPYFQVTSF